MFDLKHASLAVRKAAAAHGIKSGKYEPVNNSNTIDPAIGDNEVVAIVYNRNHRDGVKITAGDIAYVNQYM